MTLEEYELYELIKPSFKQNVNFSTEAKHRDPVETLVQGRRVEGIGGEEPPEQTKWKRTVDSGKTFVYCETKGNDVLILPRNQNSQAPLVQNGKIIAFTPYSDSSVVNNFVNPLNEKGYNIPESGWLEDIITLNVGDDVPNWDSYELL